MKNRLINIAISLITTVLCIILLGLISTFLIKNKGKENNQIFNSIDWDNKDINDVPSPRNWSNISTIRGTDKTYTVKINGQGLRDYEYGLKKPENSIRIAAVGDSTTFGVGVNLEDTYVKQLEKILNKNCSKKIEVINFGASGASTINELELIQRKVLLYKPDIILLEMDNNDSSVIEQIKKVDPLSDAIILKIKNSNYEVSKWFKQKLEFYLYYKYRKQLTSEDHYNNIVKPFNVIKDISKENNIKLVAVSYYDVPHNETYPKVLQYVKKSGVPLLDLFDTKFSKLSYQEKFSNPKLDKDGNPTDSHPNKYGSQIMAKEISKFLENLEILDFKKLCL